MKIRDSPEKSHVSMKLTIRYKEHKTERDILTLHSTSVLIEQQVGCFYLASTFENSTIKTSFRPTLRFLHHFPSLHIFLKSLDDSKNILSVHTYLSQSLNIIITSECLARRKCALVAIESSSHYGK